MQRLCDFVHNPEPLIMGPTITVRRACENMRHHRASAVLVTYPNWVFLPGMTLSDGSLLMTRARKR